MKRLFAAAVAVFTIFAGPVLAGLPVGTPAPVFSAQGFQGGKPLTFDLHKALQKGPVVLYFFPAAHTSGCNLEAHLFAEATDQFHALGTTVIGVTSGNLDQLAAFSTETEHCSGKFPVAADPKAAIAKLYHSTLPIPPGLSDRTSYVIAPSGKIVFVYSNLGADKHVEETLAALRAWRAANPS